MADKHSPNRNNFKMEFIVLFTIFLSYDGNTKDHDGPGSFAFLHSLVFIEVNHFFSNNCSAMLYGQLTYAFSDIVSVVLIFLSN